MLCAPRCPRSTLPMRNRLPCDPPDLTRAEASDFSRELASAFISSGISESLPVILRRSLGPWLKYMPVHSRSRNQMSWRFVLLFLSPWHAQPTGVSILPIQTRPAAHSSCPNVAKPYDEQTRHKVIFSTPVATRRLPPKKTSMQSIYRPRSPSTLSKMLGIDQPMVPKTPRCHKKQYPFVPS